MSGVDRTACFCLILAEPESLELAQWVRDLVAEQLVPPILRLVLADVGQRPDDDHSDRFHAAALRVLNDAILDTDLGGNSCRGGSDDGGISTAVKLHCLVIAIFWDGQSESVKNDFIRLRQLADEKRSIRKGGSSHESNSNSDNGTGLNCAYDLEVQFVVQTLNAKKGSHSLKESQVALVNSLRKKFPAISNVQHIDPCNVNSIGSRVGNILSSHSNSEEGGRICNKDGSNIIPVEEFSEAAIEVGIAGGQGEYFTIVSGRTMDEFRCCEKQLRTSASSIGAGCMPLVDEPREVQSGDGSKTKLIAQEFIVRQHASEGEHIELRIAMCGNVDSGKSTLTSVLTRGCRDDGRGSARAFVFKHKHEVTTGRTSSVSENHLGLSSTGEVVNYSVVAARRTSGTTNFQLAQEVMSKSAKVLTLYDLAGHERYLKTTVLGMTRNLPDYACIVISANNGIQRMTKEHLALCLALKIPFFVVVTRIDSTPENVRQETNLNIHKLLKIPTVRKLPYPVRCIEDVVLSAKNLRNDRISPIFEVSNVTGSGIQELLRFLNLLPVRKDWRKAQMEPREMVIDSTFFVKGVGTVVGGIVTQGVFHVNDTVQLGPDSFGAYRLVHIKSIHVKGVEQQRVVAGCDAAFCLKKEKRSAIRKGNILADPQHPLRAYWQFEADVTILYHSTTILVNYEPVIHSTTVRQSARIVYVAQEVLRTGDRSVVRFHFLYRPEFMKIGQRLIFREGRTKGIGTVTNLTLARDETLLQKKRADQDRRTCPQPH